ncbi:hypothetical protein Q31b_00430 [Novipirellula aureliae]|uniref:DUF4412 domain-containing protein n=1 Tax=Novipirellula aureliae TaxID=2527966 RepID=A0A5C6E5A2_9BACT|nr:hypothetical protein [Novipirellula aureliae]TWU44873.1 hypothetical protein Q31b_00430 [Novipirellula aureliae]
MMRFSMSFLTPVLLAVTFSGTIVGTFAAMPPAEAQTSGHTHFRVETKIFEGKQAKPAAHHLILFDSGLVYDVPVIDDRFVTIYDSPRSRVILIDRVAKTRTTLTIDDLVRVTAQAKSAAETRSQQERLGILATPEFDAETNTYRISFEDTAYETVVDDSVALDSAIAYGQFADLASRLNLVRRIGLPPFARMSLNQRIAADGKMPKETTLSIRRGIATDRFHAKHEVIKQLSQKDLKQIEEIGSMLALYREVPLDQIK